jgi:hypothetical protein
VRILSVQSIKPATDKELPTKSKLSKPKFKDKNFFKTLFQPAQQLRYRPDIDDVSSAAKPRRVG